MTDLRVRSAMVVLSGLLAVGVGACSNSGSAGGGASAPPTGSDAAGGSFSPGPAVTFHGLRLSGGYVPQPASPDVAAAYLTIDNTTGKAQQLTKVITNVTTAVMAMNETDTGGVGSMTDLAKVVIPAHGSYRFMPNHAHLMLEHPTRLKAGDQVTMTLTFDPAGTTTVRLPVVPIGETPRQAPSSSDSGEPSMSGMDMSGMNMSGGG